MCNISIKEVWRAFGVGKHLRHMAVHEMDKQLGRSKAKALPVCHAFTGCDVVSLFAGQGKKSAWGTWLICPAITNVSVGLASQPPHSSEEYHPNRTICDVAMSSYK